MNTCSQLCLLFFLPDIHQYWLFEKKMPQNAIYSSALDAKARSLAKTLFTWVNTPEQNGTAIFLPQILNFEGKQCPGALDIGRFWRLRMYEHRKETPERPSKKCPKSHQRWNQRWNHRGIIPLFPVSSGGDLRWELWHWWSLDPTARHVIDTSQGTKMYRAADGVDICWYHWYLIKKGPRWFMN